MSVMTLKGLEGGYHWEWCHKGEKEDSLIDDAFLGFLKFDAAGFEIIDKGLGFFIEDDITSSTCGSIISF